MTSFPVQSVASSVCISMGKCGWLSGCMLDSVGLPSSSCPEQCNLLRQPVPQQDAARKVHEGMCWQCWKWMEATTCPSCHCQQVTALLLSSKADVRRPGISISKVQPFKLACWSRSTQTSGGSEMTLASTLHHSLSACLLCSTLCTIR